MKLWLLRPDYTSIKNNNLDDPWKPWYDKTFGFVIRAEDESLARKTASEHGGNENFYFNGYSPWMDERFATCDELTPGGVEGLVLKDFAAA